MKRYLVIVLYAFVTFGVYAEGIVLSDTSIDGNSDVLSEEQISVSETKTNAYPGSRTNSLIKEQIKPLGKSLVSSDFSDPLFLTPDNRFLSNTYFSVFDEEFRIGQHLDYGVNNNLVLHANLFYQIDFSDDKRNGFSATELGGIYRVNNGTGTSRIISDVLFGLRLWGSSHVRTPEYADSSYYAGLRFGRQYTGITLSGTVKSTWVFDDDRGLSYLDFIPEMYFRFKYDWRAGIGMDFRKSTNTYLLGNQEWLNFKLLRQYGNTQYVGRFDYEFESKEIQIGGNIKILF